MLDVTFYRDERQRVCGLSARGHAEFAEFGKDIVCAAVSAILQTARLGLTEHAGTDVVAEQARGRLVLRWAADSESVRAIIAAAELAIDEIARRYPKHVRLKRVTDSSGRRRPRHV